MKDKVEFGLQDNEDLRRINKYIESLIEIMKLKNEDSDRSPDGGAVCHYKIEIKVEEKWT